MICEFCNINFFKFGVHFLRLLSDLQDSLIYVISFSLHLLSILLLSVLFIYLFIYLFFFFAQPCYYFNCICCLISCSTIISRHVMLFRKRNTSSLSQSMSISELLKHILVLFMLCKVIYKRFLLTKQEKKCKSEKSNNKDTGYDISLKLA